ncbi:hypothetical protein HUU40_27555, partial [candidate division KSB1 bacterium]|nr:hypothetical protein [candidate division KSB1 bacterium]
QAVWISDDRISALASQRSGGIEQIDFHGSQPVSRNAKLLQHPEGVLRFSLRANIEGRSEIVPLQWQNLTLHPAGIRQNHELSGLRITLEIAVKKSILQVQCHCDSSASQQNWDGFSLEVAWNAHSQTTEVHGHRLWSEPQIWRERWLLLHATDQIHLQEWLRRTGDYQGDFLIPEGWRRLIYKRRCVSGTARLEDVREEYLHTAFKLYDADTWILLGGESFVWQPGENGWYRFRSISTGFGDDAWHSPRFEVAFFTEKPVREEPTTESIFAIQTKRYEAMEAAVPQLEIPEFPAIGEFFRRVPQIVESARVQDFGMTRACPGTYYWIWAWDNMVTALAQTHWGDLDNLKRIVDFIRGHRDRDGSIPGRWSRQLEPMDSRGIGAMDFLFSELVLSLYAETNDRMILRGNYTALHDAFTQLQQRSHANGLFPTIGMYPDLPAKMGRDENCYVAIDEGAWYGLCRNLEKIAWLVGDQPTAEKAARQAGKIAENFLATFWDEEKGFMCDAFDPRNGKRNVSYPLFSLLFLESPWGYALLRNKLNSSAQFISAHLLNERGLALTPAWDVNHHSEPAMSAWYPHWDFAAIKALAHAGDFQAVRRWLHVVDECYRQLGYCPEFVALDVKPEEQWQHHGAAWNLNCAAGWYNALLHGLAGLEFDLGGLTCRTTADMPAFRLKQLHFRGGRWQVEKSGSGKFITSLAVDGEEIKGTLKIPPRFYTADEHQLRIHYAEKLPHHPMLLELWGAELVNVDWAKDEAVFLIHGFGQTDLCFSCPEKPELYFDGSEIDYLWQPETNIARCQLSLTGEHEVKLHSG